MNEPSKGRSLKLSKVTFNLTEAGHSESFVSHYDRSRLQLGSLVYVSHNPDGRVTTFSPTPEQGGEAYSVLWISPSEWVVFLGKGIRELSNLKTAAIQVLEGLLEAEVVSEAIEDLASEMRLQHLYKTSEFERSRLGTVAAATDRLDLVRKLSSPDIGRALFSHWQPLCLYLLLTCFDLLGQPAERMTFDSWLRAERVTYERDAALALALEKPDLVSQCEALYLAYAEWYGVRKSFHRFIDVILPEDARRRLLESILMIRRSLPPDMTQQPTSDEDKKTFLYRIRNDYTHNARFRPGLQMETFTLGLPSPGHS